MTKILTIKLAFQPKSALNSEVLRYFLLQLLKDYNTSDVAFMYKILSIENYWQVCLDIRNRVEY